MSNQSADQPIQLTVNERCGHLVEIWKSTVQTQQHFNLLCMHVRRTGLTIFTVAVGLLAVVVKEHRSEFALSIGVAAVLVWVAFGLIDYWYHQYLKGAVEVGRQVEADLQQFGLRAPLATGITAASHKEKIGAAPPAAEKGCFSKMFTLAFRRSTGRLVLFYLAGAVALIILTCVLGWGSGQAQSPCDAITPKTDVSPVRPLPKQLPPGSVAPPAPHPH